MRHSAYILSLIFALISCSSNSKGRIQKSVPRFCNNELNLISSFDSIQSYDLNLFNFRVETEEKLMRFIDDPYCKPLRFNLNFKVDSHSNFKLTLNTLFAKDCELHPYTPRHFCHVLLNKKGKVLIEGELCSIDSVASAIHKFYRYETENYDSPKILKRVFIAILWDAEVEEDSFNKIIEQIIDGYLAYADFLSNNMFSKPICELTDKENYELFEILPFNLRTDFLEGFESIDFLPSELPIPLDDLEIKIDSIL